MLNSNSSLRNDHQDRILLKIHKVESVQARPEDDITEEIFELAHKAKGVSLRDCIEEEILEGRNNRYIEHEKRIIKLIGELTT